MRGPAVIGLVIALPLFGLPLTDAASGDLHAGLPVHPDIPPTAMRAYVTAAEGASEGCRTPWWVLAGIGKVESDHGRYGARTLHPDGRSSPPIIGIALDGSHGTRVIVDTDGGRMDGDTVHDRAVGPMQFIPSTWRGHQRDGDTDGRADPHDLDDAAAAASHYLCAAAPGDFGDPSHARTGLLAYNASTAYVVDVLDHAHRYRDEAVTGDSAAVGPDGLACPVAGPVSFIDSWGFPRSGGRTHKGQDLFATRGTPLVALADAEVLEVAADAGLGGNVVWLGTGDGAAWYYAHLDAFAPGLAAGMALRRGAPVGTVGDTGNARGTPPHLHIQWRPDGRRGRDVNPYGPLDTACPVH